MRPIKLSAYRKTLPPPPPTMQTLRKWVRNHKIAGGFIDDYGNYYVDMDVNEVKIHPNDAAIQKLMNEDPDVERILKTIDGSKI